MGNYEKGTVTRLELALLRLRSLAVKTNDEKEEMLEIELELRRFTDRGYRNESGGYKPLD